MGSTLTPKKVVVEISLAGITTQEISQRLFIFVDRYLRTLDKILIMPYYKMPFWAIHMILGPSPKLIVEHMKLAEEHFPTEKARKEYLNARALN